MTYDFGRLAPLGFAFIDGGHDLEHVLNDSRKTYDALAPGGWIVWHDFNSSVAWMKVREAIEAQGFSEPVVHVEGTEVAFLQKGDVGNGSPIGMGRTVQRRDQGSDEDGILSHGMSLEPARNRGSFSPRGRRRPEWPDEGQDSVRADSATPHPPLRGTFSREGRRNARSAWPGRAISRGCTRWRWSTGRSAGA